MNGRNGILWFDYPSALSAVFVVFGTIHQRQNIGELSHGQVMSIGKTSRSPNSWRPRESVGGQAGQAQRGSLHLLQED